MKQLKEQVKFYLLFFTKPVHQASMLPGDVLLVASFVSYVGCFTKQYRVKKHFATFHINA